jgi:hypothetical protein
MNARLLKLVQIPLLIGVAAMLAGCQKKNESAPPGAAGGGAGGAIVSAEKNSFEEVTRKLDKGGNLFVYLSTEQTLSRLSKSFTELSNGVMNLPAVAAAGRDNVNRGFAFASALIQDSGIEHISGFGASSIAREPGLYYSKMVLHHYEGQDDGLIWSVFGKKPHPLKELDLLPDNTAFAAYSDLDIPLVWKTLQKELAQLHLPNVDQGLAGFPAQFKARTGIALDDLLGSLGGGYGIIFTVDESKKVTLPIPGNPLEISEPGLAIFAKVKSDVIFDRVDQLLAGNPMVSKSDLPDLKSRTVTIPVPLPIELSPTIARAGDYLFLTSSRALLQEILGVKAGKKIGFKSTPEFKKLSQGVPLAGNNFSLISETFGRTLGHALHGVISKQAGMLGAQAESLEERIATNAMYAFSVGANGPEGWEAVANGNKCMNAMVIPAAAGVGGMLAAIAIPNFVKAKATSQYNAIINNLRMLDAAKAQAALAKNLSSGSPISMDDLTPYLGRGGIKPVAGEFYIPNPIGTPPKARLATKMNGHDAGSEISVDDK